MHQDPIANRDAERAAAAPFPVDDDDDRRVEGSHLAQVEGDRLGDAALERTLADVCAMDAASRLEQRYQKFRQMGNVGINEG